MKIEINNVNAYQNGPCSLCAFKDPKKKDKVNQLLFHYNKHQSQGINLCDTHLADLATIVLLHLGIKKEDSADSMESDSSMMKPKEW